MQWQNQLNFPFQIDICIEKWFSVKNPIFFFATWKNSQRDFCQIFRSISATVLNRFAACSRKNAAHCDSRCWNSQLNLTFTGFQISIRANDTKKNVCLLYTWKLRISILKVSRLTALAIKGAFAKQMDIFSMTKQHLSKHWSDAFITKASIAHFLSSRVIKALSNGFQKHFHWKHRSVRNKNRIFIKKIFLRCFFFPYERNFFM